MDGIICSVSSTWVQSVLPVALKVQLVLVPLALLIQEAGILLLSLTAVLAQLPLPAIQPAPVSQ